MIRSSELSLTGSGLCSGGSIPSRVLCLGGFLSSLLIFASKVATAILSTGRRKEPPMTKNNSPSIDWCRLVVSLISTNLAIGMDLWVGALSG